MAFSKKERTGENAKPLGSARRWGAPATGTDDRSGTGSAVTNGAERPSWGVQELASSSSPKKSEYTDSHTSGPNGATAPGWDDDSVVHHIGETSHYGGSGLSSKSSNSRAIQREDWSRLDYGDTVYSRGNESRWSNSLSREPCYRNQKGRTGENVTALGVHGCWGGNVEGQQRVADTDEDAGQENPQEVGPISTQRDGAETSTQIMPAQHPIQSIHAPSHPNGTAKKQERQAAMPSAKAIAITAAAPESQRYPQLTSQIPHEPPIAPQLKRARPVKEEHRLASPSDSDPWDNMSDDGTDMDDGTDVKPTKRRSKHESGAQLVTHLPKVDEEALETFREVESNVYFSNKIGRSKGQMDGMVCDCVFNPKKEQLSGLVACGDEAECINRLTQIECCEETCLCREHCQNLRFQKKQYAQVDIVRTEKKGFGLRATYGIEADAFVYEYIGEIIPQNSFLKRMQAYKDEGLEHFYFMALAREEYIDATKVGGKARFINHSCNPNCYVSKWHVGKHMRMGIFAKRPIIAGEELSFNYNVDRYGNDAQPCYCGEPNCVGTIGGKTQTDVAGMDDLFIDALGISDEVDMAGARGSKQKKSKQLGIDFTPTLSPVPKEDVAMVVNATRQATSNPRILPMLLTRIQLTSEPDVNRAFVQLHGLVLMAGVLEEWKDNKDVVMLALGCLARWPMIARNKVNDTGIAAQVKELVSSSDADIAEVATSVSDMWNALTVGYRIARRESGQGFADDPMVWPGARRHHAAHIDEHFDVDGPAEQPTADESSSEVSPFLGQGAAPLPVTMLKTVADAVTQDAPTDVAMQEPTEAEMREEAICEAQFWPARQATPSISAIINRAKQRAELERRMQEEALASAQASAIAAADRALRKQARVLPTDSSRPHKRRRKEIARQTVKTPERKLYKQIGELIVATMSKHKKSFEKESFKRHAKELTELICAKELKKAKEREWPPKDGQVTLSEEKRGKMKKFAKEYIAKIIAHKEKVAAVAKAKTQREQKEGGKLRADEEAGVEGML